MPPSTSPHPDIILYHYPASPYAKRIVWYLNLRKIPYKQCIQPVTLPRPILPALGLAYRRIPFLSINSSLYLDTRLIIYTLEHLYPPSTAHPSLLPPDAKDPAHALTRLLGILTCDGQIFLRASQLLPPSLPTLRDPKFKADREQLTGSSWSEKDILARRPEAITVMKSHLKMLEFHFFKDGQQWILDTPAPTLADLEAVWPLVWLVNIPGALEDRYFGDGSFGKTLEWVKRFDARLRAVEKENGRMEKIGNEEAVRIIESADFAEGLLAVDSVSENDETGLKKGDVVEVWPVDSGSRNRDHGKLIGLNGEEVVWETHTAHGKAIRVHAPRRGFRVRKYVDTAKI